MPAPEIERVEAIVREEIEILGPELFVVEKGERLGRVRIFVNAPTREKIATYESGVDPVGRGWSQTQVRYYLYAFLYVLFAVDAVFLFPWATVVKDFGWATVAEMGAFVGVLNSVILP